MLEWGEKEGEEVSNRVCWKRKRRVERRRRGKCVYMIIDRGLAISVLVTSCSVEGSEERSRARNPSEEDESKQARLDPWGGGGQGSEPCRISSSSSGALELLDSKRGKRKAKPPALD
jgi:hypothetical protein